MRFCRPRPPARPRRIKVIAIHRVTVVSSRPITVVSSSKSNVFFLRKVRGLPGGTYGPARSRSFSPPPPPPPSSFSAFTRRLPPSHHFSAGCPSFLSYFFSFPAAVFPDRLVCLLLLSLFANLHHTLLSFITPYVSCPDAFPYHLSLFFLVPFFPHVCSFI